MAGRTRNARKTQLADEGSDVHAQLRELQAQNEELQRARDEVRKTLPPTPTYREKVCAHHHVCLEPVIS